MNRRSFLQSAALASGALLLPLPVVAALPATKKVFRFKTVPSGWTTGPHADHYSSGAVVRIFEIANQKLLDGKTLPVYENYDQSRPPIGRITRVRINESREVLPVTVQGEVVEMIPGRSITYLTVEVETEQDMTGRFCGPCVHMDTDTDAPMTHVTVTNMLDVDGWSVFDETKFQGSESLAGVRVA